MLKNRCFARTLITLLVFGLSGCSATVPDLRALLAPTPVVADRDLDARAKEAMLQNLLPYIRTVASAEGAPVLVDELPEDLPFELTLPAGLTLLGVDQTLPTLLLFHAKTPVEEQVQAVWQQLQQQGWNLTGEELPLHVYTIFPGAISNYICHPQQEGSLLLLAGKLPDDTAYFGMSIADFCPQHLLERATGDAEEQTRHLLAQMQIPPEALRQQAVAAVHDFLAVYNIKLSTPIIHGAPVDRLGAWHLDRGANWYLTPKYAFVVDNETGAVLVMDPREVEPGGFSPFLSENLTRYSEEELEEMAHEIVSTAAGVSVGDLEPLHGRRELPGRETIYQFMWQGDRSIAQAGEVHCSEAWSQYPELEIIYNEEGVPCVQRYIFPSVNVALTQSGRLVGFTNAGFYENLE